MRRRQLLGHGAASLGWAAAPDWAQAAPTAEGERVLRYAFPTAETGFDPHQISDLYSITVTSNLFEGLYDFDHLARPFLVVPVLADGMPEASADHRSFTVRLKRGIYFQDDPAFGGKRREVTAADWIYTFKRVYDPAVKCPGQPSFEEGAGILGLQELHDAAVKAKRPFDYDATVEGLSAPDPYTLRIRLRHPRPRFIYQLTGGGVMAREVVEHYGDKISEHPVGTGPFRLKSWRRSSQIVLERNPGYRERYYDARPNADDAEGQALLARFKGRRLPMLDRVEISIIEEAQPRWLSFLNGEQDLLQIVPPEFIPQAIPGGELAPHLAKKGIRKVRQPASDVSYLVFNAENAAIGGNAPEKVALRRAVSLGYDVEREIRLVRRGEAVPAQGLTVPGTSGYDPTLRTEASVYSPARAKALLDIHGYLDRNGDGWRERPDGQPLVLELLAQSDQTSRALDEVFQKNMAAIGLKVELKVGQWAENLRACRAGRFMLWRVGSSAGSPDGQSALERAYSGEIGKGNLARFSLPAFDAIYQRMTALPDGPERESLFREANRLAVAYMPYRMTVHRIVCDLVQPQVHGYRRPPYWLSWWAFVDVDPRPVRR